VPRGPTIAQSGEARLRRVLVAVSLSMFVVQLDYFALNLALPEMARDLDVSTTDLQWAISGYMLAVGALLILGGRLGDIYGRRRVLLAGLTIFGGAALGAGAAPSADLVIALRIVQGVGASMIFPVGIAVLANAFPAARQGRAIGVAYGLAALGSALGPFAGGGLTEALSWRWVLFVMVPLCAVALVLVVSSVQESRDETVPRHIDVPGVITVSLGIAGVTFAVDRAEAWGWLSGRTLGMFAAGLLLLVVFVAVERRVRFPLVEMSLFRNRAFDLVVASCTVANICFVVMVFCSTIYLQQVRSLSPLVAGVVFLAPSVGSGLGGPLSSRLGERFQARWVMAGANGVGGAGVLALALAGPEGWVIYLVAFAIAGVGLGVGWAFASVGTQAVVRRERAGEASGVTLTLLVGLGGLFIAVSASLLEEIGQGGTSPADAIRAVLVGVAVLGLLSSLLLALGGRHASAAQAREAAEAA
jgi:EmrB/QacA subfamily drug resistance transporter